MKDILKGKLVRLCAFDNQEMGRSYAVWNRDSEFARFLNPRGVHLQSPKHIAQVLEKESGPDSPANHFFAIRALQDDRLLGDVNLDVINQWGSRDAFVGIGLGERRDWGRGYGTEAMQLVLQFAFLEINLRRVTLTVFEYNPRAIRSYERVGFRHEGRLRGALLRDGKRWDVLYMGILREDWKEMES